MKTLYDLLGALPDDDAEGLRAAFRKAAKAAHPDINTGDPDAPLRFRQIVRANAILSDVEQRATYDRLLALTRRQPSSKSKRSFVSGTIRKLAVDATAVALLSVVSIGAYTLFGHISKASVIPEKAIEVTAHVPAGIAAATPMGQVDNASRDGPSDRLEAEIRNEAAVPGAVAPAADAGGAQAIANVGPAPPDVAANDAKSHRERGIFAYRDGDLPGALADFDRAIQLDPTFKDAYVDRGIVLYRMQEFDRAFADISRAKRIENLNRTKALLPTPRKISPSSGKG